jgi:hypothetical protein
MVMNLAEAVLVGRGLEAFLSEWWAQDIKNKTRKAKEQTEYTPQQIYDCAIFELAIHAFDMQSGWRDAFERQREYMRRDLCMGKLSPENSSQRLQDLNKFSRKHMESHCQIMKSGPLWDKPSHLNGQ